MAEIEFSAVNIGDLWGKLYNSMRDLRHWEYYIKGIYEQDNKKFAIIYDEDMKLYRLDFSLTEEGLVLSDEIIEVKEEFIETDSMKKFAEPENIADYQKEEKMEENNEEEEPHDGEDDKDEEESLEKLMARISKLEKDIEDRDNIIMNKDKEIKELKDFKDKVESKEKATMVESLINEISEFLDEETLKNLRDEGLSCDMCDMDSWKNKAKAYCFSAIKKQPKKKSADVWGFSAPVTTQKNNKDGSVWNRI